MKKQPFLRQIWELPSKCYTSYVTRSWDTLWEMAFFQIIDSVLIKGVSIVYHRYIYSSLAKKLLYSGFTHLSEAPKVKRNVWYPAASAFIELFLSFFEPTVI